MNAYLSCVGCEQRELDAQRVLDYLKKNEISITSNPRTADYLFIITCGVDSSGEDRSILEIKSVAEQRKSGSRLIIGGCLPSISPNKILQFGADHIFSPRSIESLDNILELDSRISHVIAPNRSIYDEPSQEEYDPKSARERFERAKRGYKVVVANGCLGTCSYCMIKEATGRLQSKPVNEIIAQIKNGINEQEPTIMLMAGDTGAYGQDIGTSFVELLDKTIQLEGNFRVYIHDFGIDWLIKDLEKYSEVFALAEEKQRVGGISIPLQSGSDNILRRMNRKYERKDAINAVRTIAHNSFDIGTHIMVGFPGESDHDFEDTIDLLQTAPFDFVTCFPYSEHPRASSASLDKKVPPEIIQKRLERISQLLRERVKVMQ